MEAFLKVVRDLGLLVARIVVGVTLVAHGWYRWTVIGLEDQATILEGVGLPSSEGLVIATLAFELIGGVLLIFGLATPLVGLGMIIQNVATILTTRSEAGFFQHDGGWEYNAVLASFGLIFLVFGCGRAGLDHLFLRPKDDKDLLIEPDERDRVVRERKPAERPKSYPGSAASNASSTRTGSTRVDDATTEIIEKP